MFTYFNAACDPIECSREYNDAYTNNKVHSSFFIPVKHVCGKRWLFASQASLYVASIELPEKRAQNNATDDNYFDKLASAAA